MTALTLAKTWGGEPVEGYLMSEKLDGIRALWDGSRFVSRHGNPLPVPRALVEQMPAERLDGELYLGRGRLYELIGLMKRGKPEGSDWADLRFMAFDAPDHGGPLEDRIEWLSVAFRRRSILHMVANKGPLFWRSVRQRQIPEESAMFAFLREVIAAGGEGLILRKRGSLYEAGRSATMLKIKDSQTAEARVIGRNVKRSYRCELIESGARFSVTAPAAEKLKAGDVITVEFQELTAAGKPRHPAFLCVRDYE